MTELELTYLTKYLPKNLKKCRKVEVFDFYIPKSSPHPYIRIRKIDGRYEIVKKKPINKKDPSVQEEQVIPLTKDEYQALMKIPGKKVRKIRYYYKYKGKTAEVDIFLNGLKGLVVVEFEFETIKEKNAFKMPDFCLADVTQEKLYAGGLLAGKKYKDFQKLLEGYGYKPIYLK